MISIDYSLIIVILNFVLLLIVLNKLLFKPLKQFLTDRQIKVQQEIEQAQGRNKSAQELMQKRNEELKNSSEEIRELNRKAKKDADLKAQGILIEAKERKKKIMKETDEQIIHKQGIAQQKVEQNLALLVSDLTAKLLSKKVDSQQDKDLIESIIKEGK